MIGCMCVEWKEHFSKAHPLRIKENDLFLHGTSSRKYSAIQRSGFLLRKAPNTNWGISQMGVCFEKYVKHAQYCGVSATYLVDRVIKHYCEIACKNDGSLEGVVLQTKGRELKELGCPIYADWNKPYPLIRDVEEIPVNVDSDLPVLSIIVLDCDIPLRYLEAIKRVPFKAEAKLDF